ncbi:hypothetical protein [Bradyrhizobium sp.]|uniref:hypothetical protein n=1 Tax=Bradyrhizobium sp. TaxID=376 RepID=UPI0039E66C49
MQQASTISWLVRCATVAAVLVLACGLATARFGSTLQQPAVTTRDGSLVTLNRYVREPIPDIVLVGSSVTWRLKEQYYSLPRVRNLAVAAGSPLTSLEIAANQPRLPKIILIETNVLSRLGDTSLIERFSGGARAEPLLLRPVRTAIAAYENWNHAPPDPAQARAERDNLLSRPPSTFNNRPHLDRALEQLSEGDPSVPARLNVARIRALIDQLQRRGTRVFLIHVPFAPEIEASSWVRTTKEIAHEAFPDPALWLPIDPPLSELRWADGVHLDERSALIVVRAIESAMAARIDAHRP